MNICLLENDINLSNLSKIYLEDDGYSVIQVITVDEAKSILKSYTKIDLWIIDNELKNGIIDMIDCNKVPIIYISKPYVVKELVKEVKNLYKEDIVLYNKYRIDIDNKIIYENDEKIKLTSQEFDMLMLFINNVDKNFSRKELLYLLWGNNYYGSDRVVDDLVRRLRKKMKNLKIDTIYGYGYKINN